MSIPQIVPFDQLHSIACWTNLPSPPQGTDKFQHHFCCPHQRSQCYALRSGKYGCGGQALRNSLKPKKETTRNQTRNSKEQMTFSCAPQVFRSNGEHKTDVKSLKNRNLHRGGPDTKFSGVGLQGVHLPMSKELGLGPLGSLQASFGPFGPIVTRKSEKINQNIIKRFDLDSFSIRKQKSQLSGTQFDVFDMDKAASICILLSCRYLAQLDLQQSGLPAPNRHHLEFFGPPGRETLGTESQRNQEYS